MLWLRRSFGSGYEHCSQSGIVLDSLPVLGVCIDAAIILCRELQDLQLMASSPPCAAQKDIQAACALAMQCQGVPVIMRLPCCGCNRIWREVFLHKMTAVPLLTECCSLSNLPSHISDMTHSRKNNVPSSLIMQEELHAPVYACLSWGGCSTVHARKSYTCPCTCWSGCLQYPLRQ